MPPSGYTQGQAGFISEFLSSCSESLARERIEKCETYCQALGREIADINRHLETPGLDLAQTSLLRLTLAFYQQVLSRNPVSARAYSDCVSDALREIMQQVLAIHIEPAETV